MHPDMRVFFASAYGREDNTVKELVQIGDGYITKPFELNVLLKKINSILG
jgi:DNA-binding response OmpR family regulator